MFKLLISTCFYLVFNVHSAELQTRIETLTQIFQSAQKSFPEGKNDNIDDVQEMIRFMYELDQTIRNKLSRSNDDTANRLIHAVDQFCTDKMKRILAEIKWPNISEYGEETDNNAWLLVQHSDNDLDFQNECLLKLKILKDIGETNKRNYAYLHDRVAIKSERFNFKQRYGTQVNIIENEINLKPYEGSLEQMDERRKSMSLESTKEYLETVRRFYFKP